MKIFLTLVIAVVLVTNLGAGLALAQGTSNAVQYTPLEPIPGLQNGGNICFASLLNQTFKVLFTAGALFAVVMLVWGGISYMVSQAVGELGEAKKRMWAAIYGLLLLAGAWLILNTINPQLLVFNISGIPCGSDTENSSTPNGGGTGGETDRSVKLGTFSGGTQTTKVQNAVCPQTGTCSILSNYITFYDQNDQASKKAIKDFTTTCNSPHMDNQTLESNRGTVKTFSGDLIGEVSRTGMACVLR